MPTSPVLVFDIESIPDTAGLRILRGDDPALDERAVYEAELARRKEQGRGDFMPLYLQRVLVISCVFRSADRLHVHSLVDREPDGRSQEGRVIQRFFQMIERHVPQLVSWNGGGFDLPVLNYRALRHGVIAPKYWDTGEDDREFRFSNYLGRYHTRHLDLMDMLSRYQSRAVAPLDALARLCGFPGKLGMDGSQVYAAYLEGRTDEVRRYCESDAMNTYLLYCRFQRMRGACTEEEYAREIAHVRTTLAGIDEPHWREYLAAWPVDPAEAALAAQQPPLFEERSAPPAADLAGEEAPRAIGATTAEKTAETTISTETQVYIDSSSMRS
jgi:predicted PolB exonuclease-like 3'-5' exonuclease